MKILEPVNMLETWLSSAESDHMPRLQHRFPGADGPGE